MGRVTRGIRVGVVAAALLLTAGCFWPVAGQGPNRQAFNGQETEISRETVGDLTLAWEAHVDDGAVGDPITSAPGLHVNDAHAVYDFNRVSGARVWKYAATGASDQMGQPSVVGDRVVANVILGSPTGPLGGARIDLDAGTGSVLSGPTNGRFVTARGTREVRFNEAFFRSWLWSLTVVDTTTGTNDCCVGLFGAGDFLPAPPPFTLTSTAVLHSGQGIVRFDLPPFDPAAIGNGVRAYTIDADAICAAGTYTCPNWVTPTDGTRATPPVLSDDEATTFVGTDAGTVYAVDTQTGTVRWSAPVGSAVTDAPALAYGSLYVPTAGGDLVALAADGCGAPTCAPLWTAATGASVTQQPAAAGGVVFTGSADGALHAFDADGCGGPTCPALWSASTGSEITGAPAVALGRLFVGTADGRLVTYKVPSAS